MNVGRREAEAFHHAPLRSARPARHSSPYKRSILCRDLGSDTALAVLHRPVPPHVHLVLAMGRPAKIVDVVVAGVPVVVRNIGLSGGGRRQERQANQSVGEPPLNGPRRVPKSSILITFTRVPIEIVSTSPVFTPVLGFWQ